MKSFATAGCLVTFGLGVLLLAQQGSGKLWSSVLPVPVARIDQVEGPVFKIVWSRLPGFPGRYHPAASVLENGAPLPVRAPSSKQVKEGANGAFTIGARGIWFRSPDGSDPRANGRSYAVRLPQVLPPGAFGFILLLFAASGAMGYRATVGSWPWPRWASVGASPRIAPAPKDPGANRRWSLDALRAVAILLVLFSHMTPCPESASPAMNFFSRLWTLGGGVGVDLFFVLSGYLVSGLLWGEWKRTGTLRLTRFLCRRGFKIYPAFWVMLLGTLLIRTGFDLDSPPATTAGLLGEVTFLQNYVGKIWGPTWSLAVEEHFYLLLALTFALLVRRQAAAPAAGAPDTARALPILFGALAIGCLSIRCLRVAFLGTEATMGNYVFTHCRLDALGFGVFLRYCQERWPEGFHRMARRGGRAWVWAGIGLMAAGASVNLAPPSWARTLAYALVLTSNYAGAGCLVLSASAWESNSRARNLFRPLLAVGRDSYSIYLWHSPVLLWVANPLVRQFHQPDSIPVWGLHSLIFLLGSIALGIALGELVERPLLNFRDRLIPSRYRTVKPERPLLPDA